MKGDDSSSAERRRVTAASLILLGAALLNGCFDHRRAVAFNLLVTPEGRVDEKAFGAALSARFPAGSSAAALRRFVTESKGHCDARSESSLWCEIPLRGVICGAEVAGLTVSVSSGRVGSIQAKIGGIGC
jgi:hypothetical protein